MDARAVYVPKVRECKGVTVVSGAEYTWRVYAVVR